MNRHRHIFVIVMCAIIFFALFILFKNKSTLEIELQKPYDSIPVDSSDAITLKHYEPKEFNMVMGAKKLSTKQIKEHKELYVGYVNKRNEVEQDLQKVDKSKSNSTHSTFRGLKVSENFARNATILHELYFENIGSGTTIGKITEELLIKNFGSIEVFKQDLMATAIAARGWALTCYNFDDQRIQNYLIDSHYEKVPIFCIPLLIIDVYEHAYMIDFGINRKAYLELLWDNIDWDVVEERIKIVVGHAQD